jgi:hypothetical protein
VPETRERASPLRLGSLVKWLLTMGKDLCPEDAGSGMKMGYC